MLYKKGKILIVAYIILLHFSVAVAQNYIISGVVKNARTKDGVGWAKINIFSLSIETITDKNGYYMMRVPFGKYKIRLTANGYKHIEEEITIERNTLQYFFLQESEYYQKEIIVTDKKNNENVTSTAISKTTIDINQLKFLPNALAEIDVVRSLLNTPGVSASTDLITGFNVRGGGVDQNLIVLDNMSLFNPYHFSGAYSAFNSDALQSISLYKTIIPLEYGGRTSSVLEMIQKTGNKEQYKASIFISLLDSKAMVEGPLGSEKGSFMIAARRSYFDLYMKLLSKLNITTITNDAENLYFYDVNASFNYSFDEFNTLYLSCYIGQDVVNYQISNNPYTDDKTWLNKIYGNIAMSIRWKHIFSNDFFSNLVFSYTNYSLKDKQENSRISQLYTFNSSKPNAEPVFNRSDTTKSSLEYSQRIIDIGLKYAFLQTLSKSITIKYGVEGQFFILKPGETTTINKLVQEKETKNVIQSQTRYFTECAAFIGVEHTITDFLRLDYGVRGSGYFGIGPLTTNEYENNAPVLFNDGVTGIPSVGKITGSTSYKNGELTSSYWGIEPRLSGRFLINEETSIKIGYSWLKQYIQLTTTSFIGLPIDTWYVSDKYIQPQASHNFSLGVFRNFFDNEIEISVEGYFRYLQNINDYVEGSMYYKNTNVEQIIYQTEGRAYGVEVFVSKNRGKRNHWTDNLVGTCSYTYSKAERKIPDQVLSSITYTESNYYPLPYDKTHVFNLSAGYYYNEWTFSLSFTYQTNIPTRIPVALYTTQGSVLSTADMYTLYYYGSNPNQYRLSDYHRLDVSIRKDFIFDIPSINRTLYFGITLSVMNVYNQFNPIMIVRTYSNVMERRMIPIIPCLAIELKI